MPADCFKSSGTSDIRVSIHRIHYLNFRLSLRNAISVQGISALHYSETAQKVQTENSPIQGITRDSGVCAAQRNAEAFQLFPARPRQAAGPRPGVRCPQSSQVSLSAIVNNLAHRDYSHGYVTRIVIEKDSILVESGNRAHGIGMLVLNTFKPFARNPLISRIFREAGFANELGSGMRNSYKYTKLYSGAKSESIEGDAFEIIIPLTTGAMTKVSPGTSPVPGRQAKWAC